MKFRGHETFYIRRNWIPKGIINIIKEPGVFMGTHENPMDVLGIGSNMVKSLRYWLQAIGISYEINTGKKIQNLTELGEIIKENDLYLEEQGTLWLLHYRLASNKELASTWYYFFNEFSLNEFTKNELENSLKLFGIKNDLEISDRVIEDDVSCLLNTYCSKEKNEKKQNPEDNIRCPFDELGLIKQVNKKEKIYKKSITNPDLIDPIIALAVITEQAQGKKELKLSSLQSNNNIGKIFNLDIIGILNILRKLEKLEYLQVIRTAGLDIIKLKKNITFTECVKKYYKNINCKEKY